MVGCFSSRQEGKFGAEGNACTQVNQGYTGPGLLSANGIEALALQQRVTTGESDAATHQKAAATPSTNAIVDIYNEYKKKEEEEELQCRPS